MSLPATPPDEAILSMLDVLSDYLPAPPPPGPPPVPASCLSIVSLAKRGIRLDAVVRFRCWASDAAETDRLIAELHDRLSGATAALRATGFLGLSAETTSDAEDVAGDGVWRATADYRVLYELGFDDEGGLLVEVPFDVDPFGESTLVGDDMVHWSDAEAPTLEARGGGRQPRHVGSIYIVASLPPGWNGGPVTVTASIAGTVHERLYPSVRELRDAFALEPSPVPLGGKLYRTGSLALPNADLLDEIVLAGSQDFLRIRYDAPAFDGAASVYLGFLG